MITLAILEYDGEEINDIEEDILEYLNDERIEEEQGMIKGTIRITVEYTPEPRD